MAPIPMASSMFLEEEEGRDEGGERSGLIAVHGQLMVPRFNFRPHVGAFKVATLHAVIQVYN
jgi:hypothetical protein